MEKSNFNLEIDNIEFFTNPASLMCLFVYLSVRCKYSPNDDRPASGDFLFLLQGSDCVSPVSAVYRVQPCTLVKLNTDQTSQASTVALCTVAVAGNNTALQLFAV